ncbi:MAG: hypothetical protein CVU81_03435 [Euryarchaeota archaeon HGW-Euryarchaeota-1]|nr:MAG: hypothetical protein CVU81_03435 [Euryarchaeota archaeon HGW-Euryarchaeota-1]
MGTDDGKRGKKFARFVISFVIAFMAAVYYQIGTWMADFFAHGAILIIIFIMAIIITGMLGISPMDLFADKKKGSLIKVIMIILFMLVAWWIGGMVCIHDDMPNKFEVSSCLPGQMSFLQKSGFPTLQNIFSGGSSSRGANVDIWNNDMFVAILVLVIFALLLGGLYMLMGKT